MLVKPNHSIVTAMNIPGFNQSILQPEDLKEIAKRERFKQREELRKKRIFNTKSRLIGIDVPSLERQIQEKYCQHRSNSVEDQRYALLQQQYINEANYRERLRQMQKKLECQAIDSFRKVHQKKELRKEYDLEAGHKPYPNLIGREDNRFGVTIFEGEDLRIDERVKVQKQQQRNWLLQQMLEREHENHLRSKAEREYEDSMRARDDKAVALGQLEENCRRQIEKANLEYNKALANQRAVEKYMRLEEEIQMNEVEKYNTVTSDFLLETADRAKSCLGPHKFNTMMYKGMSNEQIQEIKKTQLQQMKEFEEKKHKEFLEEMKWDNFSTYLNRTISKFDSLQMKEIRDRSKDLRHRNQQLGEEQQLQNRYMNDVVFANEIKEDFFDQFNTQTR